MVTQRGRPVARLVPLEEEKKPLRSVYGLTKGSMKVLGDIVSPLPNEWEVEQD